LEDILESSLKVKRCFKFVETIIKYVGDNIKKRITLIIDIWELATSSTTLSTRILNFKEYLQKDLENDEHFYKEVVNTFSAKISSMNDVHRREQNLPSKV
jgi:phage-related protein